MQTVESVLLRIHGSAGLPTLIYLPGLHGNWKLLGGFRRALGGRVCLTEFSYPSTLTWSLEDHAAAVVCRRVPRVSVTEPDLSVLDSPETVEVEVDGTF